MNTTGEQYFKQEWPMTKRKMREVTINIVYTKHAITRYVYNVERTTFYTHQGLRQNKLDNSISTKVYIYQYTNRTSTLYWYLFIGSRPSRNFFLMSNCPPKIVGTVTWYSKSFSRHSWQVWCMNWIIITKINTFKLLLIPERWKHQIPKTCIKFNYTNKL